MLSFIKKIFSDPTADWPRSVTDAVLGELRGRKGVKNQIASGSLYGSPGADKVPDTNGTPMALSDVRLLGPVRVVLHSPGIADLIQKLTRREGSGYCTASVGRINFGHGWSPSEPPGHVNTRIQSRG
jgi:hypothetical protein